MGLHVRFSIVITACFVALSSPVGAQVILANTLPFSPVDCAASSSTEVTDINSYGKVVGFCTDKAGVHGFQKEGGRLSLIDVPGATFGTAAVAANSVGMVVGTYFDFNGQGHGFSLKGSTLTNVDVPASLGTFTLPAGINDAGDIVGTYQDSKFIIQSFLRHNGQFQQIAFPGSVSTALFSVNGTSQMVGYYYGSDFVTHGFLLSNGVYTTVDNANGIVTIPTSIRGDGSILGYYEGFDLQTHIFLLKNGVAQTIDLQGGTLAILHFERFAVNNTGQIVGSYQDSGGSIHGFVAQLPAASRI